MRKLPTDIIIASFRGDLTEVQKGELDEWLSTEGNKEKYQSLKRVWDVTVSNAGEFESRNSYGKFRRRISNLWKPFAIAASVVAVATSCFILYSRYSAQPAQTQTCSCLTGKSSVILPDGSVVVLHNGASITYDNTFSNTKRIVSLNGEAYFDVVKDAENVFTVDLGDLDLLVYGTTFNVSEDSQTITVSLVDGSVDVVTETGIRCALTPGHSAMYNKESGTLIDIKDDVNFASCWAQDRLTFTQASLGEVCRYLSKWYGIDIVVPDEIKKSCSYTFTIREEPIDQILNIMSRINPMKYLYTNDHRIVISKIF